MSNSIGQLIYLGDIQSHSIDLSEEENAIVKQVLSTANAKYFLEGTLLQMCEVLIWTATNIDSIEDKKVSTQQVSQEIIDKVPQEIINKYVGNGKKFIPIQIKDNLWHIDNILMSSFKPLKQVEIVALSLNTNEKTKDDYPFFALRFK